MSGKHYSPTSQHGFRSGGLVDPSAGRVVRPIDPRDVDRTQETCANINGRDDIDARQHRCEEAKLRPSRHLTGFPIGEDDQEFHAPPTPHLLSFDEAKAAGEAMFDRAHLLAPELRLGLTRDDTGWADLARIAWEAVWSHRREGKTDEPKT